jgi:sugar phosphate isomerase/epimerase
MGSNEDPGIGRPGRAFKVGIDCYGLKPLGLSPFELLDWALINDAQGVQFSDVPAEAGDPGFLRELADYARQNGLYLEWGGGQHIPFDLSTGTPRDIRAVNRKAAEQAALMGVRTIRSCSGGLMRWNDNLPSTEALLRETAKSLSAQDKVFRDHRVVLAIETHFEFTTHELLRLFEMSGAEPGGGLGICLDTMNLLTMLEDPVAATRRVLPWIVTTHVKDGGIRLAETGFVTFTAEAGEGIVDFPGIFEELAGLDREVTLSIEDHGGDFDLPIFTPAFLEKFPDLDVRELAALLKLAQRTGARLEEGRLSVLDRADWPGVCEERIKRDLATIKRMAASFSDISLPRPDPRP